MPTARGGNAATHWPPVWRTLSETMPAVVEHLKGLLIGEYSGRDELLAQARAAADEIAGARFQYHGLDAS